MEIIKYKKASRGKYKIELDDGRELSLYEEVILKYELLLKRKIEESDLLNIENDNQGWDVYYVALNSIKARFKSINDTKKFLLKKEYPSELIDKACLKLIQQGYLNDHSFAKSYINNQIITTSKGPNKIKRELLEHKIDTDIIDEEIQCFDEESQINKITKIVDKLVKGNRTRGGEVLKKKISHDLINAGYDGSIVYKVLNNFSFSVSQDIAKREYEKLYKRLSRKYSDKELEYKIREKMYQKGLYYEN